MRSFSREKLSLSINLVQVQSPVGVGNPDYNGYGGYGGYGGGGGGCNPCDTNGYVNGYGSPNGYGK